LEVQHADLPFPEIQGITDIEEFLLAAQLKITESLPAGASLIAIKLLAMNADDEAQVVLPTQHTQEHIVEIERIK
jgi:hypothetical protein